MKALKWDPCLVGERFTPSHRRSRYSTVPNAVCCGDGPCSSGVSSPGRAYSKCSPTKEAPLSGRNLFGVPDSDADSEVSIRLPSGCEAHILDHLRCRCSACMKFACKWRLGIMKAFRERSQQQQQQLQHSQTAVESCSQKPPCRGRAGDCCPKRTPPTPCAHHKTRPPRVEPGVRASPLVDYLRSPRVIRKRCGEYYAGLGSPVRRPPSSPSHREVWEEGRPYDGYDKVAMDGTMADSRLHNKRGAERRERLCPYLADCNSEERIRCTRGMRPAHADAALDFGGGARSVCPSARRQGKRQYSRDQQWYQELCKKTETPQNGSTLGHFFYSSPVSVDQFGTSDEPHLRCSFLRKHHASDCSSSDTNINHEDLKGYWRKNFEVPCPVGRDSKTLLQEFGPKGHVSFVDLGRKMRPGYLKNTLGSSLHADINPPPFSLGDLKQCYSPFPTAPSGLRYSCPEVVSLRPCEGNGACSPTRSSVDFIRCDREYENYVQQYNDSRLERILSNNRADVNEAKLDAKGIAQKEIPYKRSETHEIGKLRWQSEQPFRDSFYQRTFAEVNEKDALKAGYSRQTNNDALPSHRVYYEEKGYSVNDGVEDSRFGYSADLGEKSHLTNLEERRELGDACKKSESPFLLDSFYCKAKRILEGTKIVSDQDVCSQSNRREGVDKTCALTYRKPKPGDSEEIFYSARTNLSSDTKANAVSPVHAGGRDPGDDSLKDAGSSLFTGSYSDAGCRKPPPSLSPLREKKLGNLGMENRKAVDKSDEPVRINFAPESRKTKDLKRGYDFSDTTSEKKFSNDVGLRENGKKQEEIKDQKVEERFRTKIDLFAPAHDADTANVESFETTPRSTFSRQKSLPSFHDSLHDEKYSARPRVITFNDDTDFNTDRNTGVAECSSANENGARTGSPAGRKKTSPPSSHEAPTSLLATTRVLREPAVRSEDEWFRRHAILMSDCTRERQDNARTRAWRLTKKTVDLNESVSDIRVDLDKVEKQLDKVRTLQQGFIHRANRAVSLLQNKRANEGPPPPPPRSVSPAKRETVQPSRRYLGLNRALLEDDPANGSSDDTCCTYLSRLTHGLRGLVSRTKMNKNHRELDELYSYFVSNDDVEGDAGRERSGSRWARSEGRSHSAHAVGHNTKAKRKARKNKSRARSRVKRVHMFSVEHDRDLVGRTTFNLSDHPAGRKSEERAAKGMKTREVHQSGYESDEESDRKFNDKRRHRRVTQQPGETTTKRDFSAEFRKECGDASSPRNRKMYACRHRTSLGGDRNTFRDRTNGDNSAKYSTTTANSERVSCGRKRYLALDRTFSL
ncbi:hypothetical protein Btru_024383 [Bulinus truncatus]|nr:hypothetical protein Btru_024383 [Bulinus truncatus]